jgi:hypothetical protein
MDTYAEEIVAGEPAGRFRSLAKIASGATALHRFIAENPLFIANSLWFAASP